MTTLTKVTIEDTPFGKLDGEGRLLNAVFKDAMADGSRFGFRGDIALKFQPQVADEKRPPEYSIEQGLAVADPESGTITDLVGYLHNFAWLKDAQEVLAPYLRADGNYVFFVNNIDFLKKYRVAFGPTFATVLPLDESTVWKEAMELAGLEKIDIKKLDAAGKLDAVLQGVKGKGASYPELAYDDGVATMEPVRNRNENRPV